MLALRYVYLLALVVWLGGMIALAALAAPAVFGVLQGSHGPAGRELAGAVFGDVLRRFHYAAYACAAVMLAALVGMKMLGPRPIGLRVRVGIVGAMLGVALWSGVGISRRIAAMQRQIGGPVAALDPSDPRRTAFGRLHGLSTTLMLVNVAGGLALLYYEARAHD
jgi:uncharacterized membrane protein